MAHNTATLKMLEWTISFYEGLVFSHRPTFDGESIRQDWLEDMEQHPDDYDQEWFALVATKAIEATIDWDYIAQELINHITFENEEEE